MCGDGHHDHDHEHDGQEMVVKFEQLGLLESEFEDAELELIRKAEEIQRPLYKKRAEFVAEIPHFWALVLEQAPQEVENYLQPSDSEVLAKCLDTFEVERFELNDPAGSPRSFSLKFGFTENEWFSNTTIEKKFWFRRSKEWEGLVSEPVLINWKKGKDLTHGLNEAAYKLFQAKKGLKDPKEESELPEYKKIVDMMETTHESSVSFFGLFSFVAGYRWVSAEESAAADKAQKEELEKIKKGEPLPDEDEDEEDEFDDVDFLAAEVFPGGDEVATIFADDIWQNAIKYYKQHFEMFDEGDDEDLSSLEDAEMDDDEEESESEPVDIRALVGKGQPPKKKQRKA